MRRVLALVVAIVASIGGGGLAANQQSASSQGQTRELLYVVGEVHKPGAYVFAENLTVFQAIAMAGGPTDRADLDLIKLIRKVDGAATTIDAQLTHVVAAGDTIYIRRVTAAASQSSEHIFVAGHVRTPNRYPFRPGMTVDEAIATAGGFTPLAATRGLKVRREGPDGTSAEIAAALSDRLQPNDTVIVRLARTSAAQEAPARVFVAGHVRKPGPYVVNVMSMTVEQLLEMAGGLSERGSPRGMKIRRHDMSGKAIEIDATGGDFLLPGDTLIVRMRRL